MTTKRTPSAGRGAVGRTRSRAVAPAGSWTLSHIAEPGRKPSEGRPIVVVLGSHGSGASVLAKTLHYLGVDMVDDADDAVADGSAGLWERAALNALQDEVFEAMGRPIGALAHVLPFPAGWWRRKAAQQTKRKLVDHLRTQLDGSSRLWGFKDPRACRLLPLWREAFAELDLSPRYVLALNDPASAAARMSAAGGEEALPVTALQGELMWLVYNFDIVRHLSADGMIIVDCDDLPELGADVARDLVDRLGLPTVYAPSELERLVEDIVRQADWRGDESRRRARPALPISAPFFRTLQAIGKTGAPDFALLDRQAATINLIFDCLSPATDAMAKTLAEQREASAAREEALTAERDRLAGLIRASEEESATAAATLAEARSELSATAKTAQEARIELAAALAAEQDTRSELAVAVEEKSRVLAMIAAKDEALSRLDAGSAAGKAALAEATSRIKTLEAQVAASIAETRQAQRAASELSRERDRLAEQRASMEQEQAGLEGVVGELRRKLSESAQDSNEARERLADARREFASLQAAKEAADEVAAGCRQERDAAVQAATSLEASRQDESAKLAAATATIEELNGKLAAQRESLRREREAAAEAMAEMAQAARRPEPAPVG